MSFDDGTIHTPDPERKSSPYRYHSSYADLPPPPPFWQRWQARYIAISLVSLLVLVLIAWQLWFPTHHPTPAAAKHQATATSYSTATFGDTATTQAISTYPATATYPPTTAVAPGQPTSTPYPTHTPYPTYTPYPKPTAVPPYPTYTQPPNATATATPRPLATLQDPVGTHAAQNPANGWDMTASIENGTQPVAARTINGDDALVWQLSNIRYATFTAYYCVATSSDGSACGAATPRVQDMVFACSPDGGTWNTCAITNRTESQASTPSNGASPYWDSVTWNVNAPQGTQYIRALIQGGYSVAFGFGEADITYQP